MWTWILIIGLYALGMGIFHVLGGLAAAGDALREWGTYSSRSRSRLSSST